MTTKRKSQLEEKVESKLARVKEVLDKEKKWRILYKQECFADPEKFKNYDEYLLRGDCLIMHGVNYCIAPKIERYNPESLNQIFTDLATNINIEPDNLKHTRDISVYVPNPDLISGISYSNLEGLQLGVLLFRENVGQFTKKRTLNISTKINDSILNEKFELKSEKYNDPKKTLIVPLEKEIWITPYLNETHFREKFYGKDGDEAEAEKRFGFLSRHNYGIETRKKNYICFNDVIKYLSKKNGERFKETILNFLREDKVDYVYWDEDSKKKTHHSEVKK